MRIFLIAILTSLLSILLYVSLRPEFRSAFEADQQCHYDLLHTIDDPTGFGCDHDIETKQWILFEATDSNKPAQVLRRFRY